MLSVGELAIGNIVLGIHTLMYCMTSVILGVNIVYFYTFTKLYAEKSNFLPHDKALEKYVRIGEDKGILGGFILAFIGVVVSIVAFGIWRKSGFSQMEPETLMRFVLPAATMIEVGFETMFACFLIGILKIKWKGKNNGEGN